MDYSVSFTLTPEELALFQKIHAKKMDKFSKEGRKLKAVAIVLPIFLMLLLIFCVVKQVLSEETAWMMVGAYLLGAFLQTMVIRMSAGDTQKRMIGNMPEIWQPRTIEISEKGIRQVMTVSSCLFDWSCVIKSEQREGLLIFWLNNYSNIIIPVRAFNSEEERGAFETAAHSFLLHEDTLSKESV